jgi:uncharacterized protein Yka (UPF0111/DUF47 family)
MGLLDLGRDLHTLEMQRGLQLAIHFSKVSNCINLFYDYSKNLTNKSQTMTKKMAATTNKHHPEIDQLMNKFNNNLAI